MKPGHKTDGLKLTEEEAFSLLGLAMTSPQRLDATSEKALRKLAEYCANTCHHLIHSEVPGGYDPDQSEERRELAEMGV